MLAILNKAKGAAYAQKATIDWQTVDTEWMRFLDGQSDEWREAFLPAIEGVIIDQGNAWNAEFGVQFNVRSLFAEQWFDDYMMQFAQEIMQTTEGALNGLLQQGMREGWSIPTMSKHLDSVFSQWMTGDLTPAEFSWFEERMPRYRRDMIARSETIKASNRGSEHLFADWGVEGKEWLTEKDARTCDWCLAMNEKVIGVNEAFFAKGSVFTVEGQDAEGKPVPQTIRLNYESVTSPPLHPQCRCTILPWSERWVQLEERLETEMPIA